MKATILALVGLFISNLAYADELRIFCNEEPPTNFKSVDGHATGFTTDIVREIQKRVGNSSEIKIFPWKRIYTMALSEPNIVFFTVSRNPDREERFHWITQVTTRRSEFFGLAGSPLKIRSMDDARQAEKIGVMRGGNREKYLRDRGFTNLESVGDEGQNLRKLLSGRIDLIFMSTLEAATLANKASIPFNKLESKFTVYSNDSYIAMSKSGTPAQTVESWKDAAKKIKDDGTFGKIGEKWVTYIRNNYGVDTEIRDNVLFFWKD